MRNSSFPAEHPERLKLAAEIHARPHEQLSAPVRASHLAILFGETGPNADFLHLIKLCDLFGVKPPAQEESHFAASLGDLRLRWERHTEFSTYTFYDFAAFSDPFAQSAIDAVPAEWLGEMPGQTMVALHLAIDDKIREDEEIARIFHRNSLAGSKTMSGVGMVWSDFSVHEDGWSRMLLCDRGLTRGQTGRLFQRLSEIETYRMLALLGLPIARNINPALSRLDANLSGIIETLADKVSLNDDDRELLDCLTAQAAEAERLSAASAYRFSASLAYATLVQRRIQELREERLPGLQTIAEFMDRRLAPAMATQSSVAARQDALALRIGRAGDLLRTRVDIALEEKNRDLLKSMDRRAQLQLRLQETVEGLSVVAISYYLVGLVGYAAKGAKGAGLPVDPDLAVGLSVPLILAFVFLGLRRLRNVLSSVKP
jgi:uncharacterized membrane-anchored protein